MSRQEPIAIEDRPALRCAAIRHVGPYHEIGAAFGRLSPIAARAGLFRGGAKLVGIYYDDPKTTPAAALRSDAAIVLAEGTTIPEGLVEVQIPAGTYARMTHVGGYDGLPDAWAHLLGAWLSASGHRLGAGETYELYVNDPTEVPKEELRTELCVPLAG